jgi:hypothetical protein
MTLISSRSILLHGAVQCNLWLGSEKLMVETFFEFDFAFPHEYFVEPADYFP